MAQSLAAVAARPQRRARLVDAFAFDRIGGVQAGPDLILELRDALPWEASTGACAVAPETP
jgi:hypothetical protein